MRLEKFISDLLYEHDCVVIPGFGGLVANYRSAKLNRQTHLILPPSKHIGFNRHLKNNDGLLVSHLSGLFSISYKEAQQKIESTVSEWQTALQRDGRIFWEKIGTFFYDKAGNLQFIPEEQENYLLSSFGLLPVQLTPVIAEEEKVVSISGRNENKPKSNISWKVAAAVTIPLLAVGLWLASNNAKMDNLNLASLNPFHQEKIVSRYSLESSSNSEQLNWSSATSPLENYLKDTSNTEQARFDFEQLSFSEDGIPIAKNIPAAADKTSTTSGKNTSEVSKFSAKGRFAVIGGAFADPQNAERFLEKLKQEGFDAVYAGKRGTLRLVAYGFYDTKEEAQTAIKNIRSSGTGSAWIKRY